MGTVSPDMPMPSSAVAVQAKLGAKRAFAFDVVRRLRGLALRDVDRGSVHQERARERALVIGVELLSRLVDWTDRNTCVLFGDRRGRDGARAVDDPDRGILGIQLHADGDAAGILTIRGGGSQFRSRPRCWRRS
jgi:3-oxoacyl-[acyl-carrier-protein] synthase-3